MLGKLFRQTPHESGPGIPGSAFTHNCNSATNYQTTYDDTYTREILYGTWGLSQIRHLHLNAPQFRIVVSQDGGWLRKKQVLFDSANEVLKPTGLNNGMNKHPHRIYHNVNELNDLMFGCGLPSNETSNATKVHILPQLHTQVGGGQKYILITRLFLIIDDAENEASDVLWHPRPALPTGPRKYLSSKDKISSRFAIGLVVPVECFSEMHDLVFNQWQEIALFLVLLQNSIVKKLVEYSSDNSICVLNRRLQITSGLFQSDTDIHNYLFKCIKMFHYNSGIPRLIDSNFLIRSSIKNSTYCPIMMNWILEILNWMEFKDGKPMKSNPMHSHSLESGSSFLSTVISQILPLRKHLMEKPVLHSSDLKKKEVVRIVVMTGNPVVAKKLVFILNGLIPREMNSKELENLNIGPNSRTNSPTFDNSSNRGYDFKSPIHGENLNNTPQRAARPIPIRTKNISSSLSSSDLNSSGLYTKGWTIPNKSVASTVSTPLSKLQTLTSSAFSDHKGSEIELSKSSSSMAYLSSSLNSRLSSSHSSYSLSKWGGSFLEKWKNSTSSVYPHSHSLDFNYESNGPSAYGSISKKSSFQSLRSPSPCVEGGDDYGWPQVGGKCPSVPPQISRTQSMYDLYKKKGTDETNSFNFKRTRTGIYIPATAANEVKNISEHNTSIIREKCRRIMTSKVEISELGDGIIETKNSLNVNPGSKKDSTDFVPNYDDEMPRNNPILKNKPLAPHIAFCDEFRPEFTLQSCPLSSKVEGQVMNAMKNDLIFNQNNSDYEKINSKTILISLMAREVKLIEMTTDNDKKEFQSQYVSDLSPTGQLEESSPKEVHFQRWPLKSLSSQNNAFKIGIRKVYSPTKNSGNKAVISFIEHIFDEINSLILSARVRPSADEDLDDKVSKLVMRLLDHNV